jgi:hypothetical protein
LTYISGGPGDSAGDKIGEVTQGLGLQQLPVNEETIQSFGISATDDAGDGTVEGDVNATDFTSQVGTTFVPILNNYLVTVTHKAVAYLYQGPRPVNLGVGGDYVSLAGNYTPLGTADHALLTNLMTADQHPTAAITNLDTDQATQDQNLVDHEIAPNPHDQYVLNTEGLDTWVLAAYGGIGVDAPVAMPDIGATFQTLSGFDIGLIDAPKGVTQDFPNDGLIFLAEGVWQFSVKVSLTFLEAQAGRQIQLRAWNNTTGLAASVQFNYFVGRNQAGANLAFTLNVNFPVEAVGDLIQLQVASAASNFSGVNNIGTIYQVNSVSEAQFL